MYKSKCKKSNLFSINFSCSRAFFVTVTSLYVLNLIIKYFYIIIWNI